MTYPCYTFAMKLYNSLSKKLEEFKPINPTIVSMYHCGPTVYDFVHVGNLRTFLLNDFLRRAFDFQGYQVKQVMNITDIGHLVSDGDDGEDKMTKALRRENKEVTLENMLILADFYTKAFEEDLTKLNILHPHELPRASRHIIESIQVVTNLVERGHTYQTSDGIYFDTTTMHNYGVLGGTYNDSKDRAEARIQANMEKRSPADFALWKFDMQQGWESPWGKGFPGWHIECSGMSMKYLGPKFDIHTGGIDLKSIHHNNEIAQSECSTGTTPFVNYWVHGEMLIFNGTKLSKSTGGNITLQVLLEQGYEPLAYRYLSLQTHYRSPMNFSWEILQAAQNGLDRIRRVIIDAKKNTLHQIDQTSPNQDYLIRFNERIQDDLNIPQALAILHEVIKANIESDEKLATIFEIDKVFGLGLASVEDTTYFEFPEEISKLIQERAVARNEKNWQLSDSIRDTLEEYGYRILDVQGDQRIERI